MGNSINPPAHPDVLERLATLKPENQDYVLRRLGLTRPLDQVGPESAAAGELDMTAPNERIEQEPPAADEQSESDSEEANPIGPQQLSSIGVAPASSSPTIADGQNAPGVLSPAAGAGPIRVDGGISPASAAATEPGEPRAAAQALTNEANRQNEWLRQQQEQRQEALAQHREAWNAAQSEMNNYRFQDFWANKSTPVRLTAALAVAMGGIGAAMTHSGANAALGIVDNSIAQDLERQKAQYQVLRDKAAGAQTLYGQLLDTFRDERLADLAYLTAAREQLKMQAQAILPPPQAAQLSSAMGQDQQRLLQAAEASALRRNAIGRAQSFYLRPPASRLPRKVTPGARR
jgi:hypothetical protein